LSIFGKLDAESISSNPFKVDDGIYEGEVTKFEFRETRTGQRQIFLRVVIKEEESMFDGQGVDKTYWLPDADMDQEMLNSLPDDEKKRTLQNMATVKKDLCGEEGNTRRQGLAIDPNDLNDPDWDPKFMVGTPVMIGVKVYKDKSQIQWINKREE
jgi:hypothetical protein